MILIKWDPCPASASEADRPIRLGVWGWLGYDKIAKVTYFR